MPVLSGNADVDSISVHVWADLPWIRSIIYVAMMTNVYCGVQRFEGRNRGGGFTKDHIQSMLLLPPMFMSPTKGVLHFYGLEMSSACNQDTSRKLPYLWEDLHG